ncbi:triacylglycerol lipase [Rhodococcus rhodochrous J3]|uniref:Triacylglycerol lipase n=1 Tax=Rhodococcus rhodochrous J3 TaxID=903528 RepID=A0ABY1M6S8_RHORH|nr:lipase family protein [Rhodococcus rhodochrous]SMG19310.1 triacylglycerol lipase [Rhodococcus rhodochrous J3]
MRRSTGMFASIAAVVFLAVTPAVANAESDTDFYTPPPAFETAPLGDVLRTAPSVAAVIPNTPAALDATVTRVMYRSTNATGGPVATVGTVLVPSQPWTGPGPRPTIVLGPGTQGMGDQCAPSKLMTFGQEYEYIHIGPMLAAGYAVAVTDYEGLGTPGVHPYLNRESQGRAMLDLARATRSLGDLGLDPDGPIAFWGYSQGGMASASAAELAATYAPELSVVGAVAGSPPADLGDLAVAGDGSLLSGGIGWVVDGFISAYPEYAPSLLAAFNPAGLDVLRRAETACVFDAFTLNPFGQTSSYTIDGRPIAEHLGDELWASLVAEQQLGNRAPAMPVFVAQSTGDDFVLVQGVDTMVDKWCSAGADVTYRRYDVGPVLTKTGTGHLIGMFPAVVEGLDWLDQRFSGRESQSGCTA